MASNNVQPANPTFTPGLTPPPGVTPDPSARNGLYPYLILAEAVCVGLTGILLIIRCLVRTLLMRQWGIEDWGAVLSWILFLGYSGVLAAGMPYGAGQHQWDLTPSQVESVLYLNNVNEIEYDFAILSIKLTLLYIQQRIFAPTRFTRRWWFIMVVMLLNTIFYLGLTFAKIFLCAPRDAIWNKSVKNAKCGSLFGTLIASGVWNTVSDIVILLMPIFFVWQLKLARVRRLSLIGVFVIGVIAPVFSVVGVVMRIHYVNYTDSTYSQWRVLLYAYAELTAGLICTSLPIMPRFYKWLRGERGQSDSWQSGGKPETPGRYGYVIENSDSRRNGRRSTFKTGIQGLADKDLLTTTKTYFELGEMRDDSSLKRLGEGSENGDGNGTVGVKSSNAVAGGKKDALAMGGGSILKTTDITVIREERHDARREHHGGDHDSQHSGASDLQIVPVAAGSAV